MNKKKIQKELNVLNTIQIADHNKMAKKINHLENLTKTLATVSATEFFEKMLEIFNKGDSIESHQCITIRCEEQFEDQKSFFNHVIKEHMQMHLLYRDTRSNPILHI